MDELHKYVGGYFQVIKFPFVGLLQLAHPDRDAVTVYEVTDRTLVLVNEDGQALRLAVNVLATKLYSHKQRGFPVLGDVLCVEYETEFK